MSRILTMRKALTEAFFQEMERDPTVIMLGEDIAGGRGAGGQRDAWGGDLGITKGLIGRFGEERVLDMPISEQAYLGMAVGAAISGLRPVAELMYVDFVGIAFDAMLNQAAKYRFMLGRKMPLPVVLRVQYGAGFRAGPQHSQTLYSLFTHIPGLKVVVPATAHDAKGLMMSAIRDDDPVVYFEHKVMYGEVKDEVPETMEPIPFGQARLVRAGRDVTIVAIGRMVYVALRAAAALAAQGIEAEILDPRTLSPLDLDSIIDSVESTGRLVVVDESHPRCSLAADIIAQISERAFDTLRAAPRAITAPHSPIPFAPSLEDAYLPSTERVVAAVLDMLDRKASARGVSC